MKSEDLFRAIGEIDEDLLTEKKPVKRHISIWMEIAASICICCLCVTAAVRVLPDDSDFKVWHDPDRLEPALSLPQPPETQPPAVSALPPYEGDGMEKWDWTSSNVQYLPLEDPGDLWSMGVDLGSPYHIGVDFVNDVIYVERDDGTGVVDSAEFKEISEGNWTAFLGDSELSFYSNGENVLLFSAPEGEFQYLDGLNVTKYVQTIYPFQDLQVETVSDMRFFRPSEGESGAEHIIASAYYANIVSVLNNMVVYQFGGEYRGSGAYLHFNVNKDGVQEEVFLHLPDKEPLVDYDHGNAYCALNGWPFIMGYSDAMALLSECELYAGDADAQQHEMQPIYGVN